MAGPWEQYGGADTGAAPPPAAGAAPGPWMSYGAPSGGQTWRSLPAAAVDEGAPAPEPGFLSSEAQAFMGGIAEPFRQIAAAPAALRGEAQPQPADQRPWERPIQWGDWMHPAALMPKLTYQFSSQAPAAAGAIVGGIGGAALTAETGPGAILGGAAGAGIGAAVPTIMQSIAPYVQAEIATGAPRDEAVKIGVEKAIQAGAFAGLGYAAFNVMAPMRALVTNAFLQAAQPGVEAAEAGKPIGAAVGNALPGVAAAGAMPLVSHAAGAVLHSRTPAPGEPGGGPTVAETVVPRVRTPEEIENEDDVGPPAAQQIALAEAARVAAQTGQRPGLPTSEQAQATLQAVATGQKPPEAAPRAPAQPAPPGAAGKTPIVQPVAMAPAPVTTGAEIPVSSASPASAGTPSSGGYQIFRPGDLTIRPDVMQFKASDENGVTGPIADPSQDAMFGRRETDTPEFRRWFGESRVTDDEGHPLVVYHGSRSSEPFTEFNQDAAAKTGRWTADEGADVGFHFTQDAEIAGGYGTTGAYYLSLKNPVRITDRDVQEAQNGWLGRLLDSDDPEQERLADFIQQTKAFDNPGAGYYNYGLKLIAEGAKENGRDGVILTRQRDFIDDRLVDEYIAFRPEQIKSAIDNAGTFDPNDPRIAFGRRPGQPGITAYHGSPHDFDRFDISKIGIGEGAQSFGHGLYFTERESIARHYRDKLSREAAADTFLLDGKQLTRDDIAANKERGARGALEVLWQSDDVPAALSELRRLVAQGEERGTYTGNLQEAAGWLRANRDRIELKSSGRMYKTRLHLDPEKMLDWDKPLSEQPKAVEAIKAYAAAHPEESFGGSLSHALRHNAWDITGKDLLHGLGSPTNAARILHAAGIEGIRYLDQGSRRAGDGTHNFVVFDDKLIDIERKYNRGQLQAEGPAPHPDAVAIAIDTARRITGGHVRVEALDPEHKSFRVVMPDGTEERVFGYQLGRLIRAAIEPGRTGWNLDHESWHALEALGLVKPGEAATLRAQAEREGWLAKHKIAERYPDLDAKGQMREALAEQFAAYQANPRALATSLMDRIMARLQQFVARLRNALAGRGFRTAEDVFGAAGRGEIGAREPGRYGEATDLSADEAAAQMRRVEAQYGRRKDEGKPLIPATRERLGIARAAADEVRQLFAPTSRGTGAKSMEHMIRASAAEKARANVQSTEALEKLGHMVDRIPVSEQLAITDRREMGEAQPTPELNRVIDALRAEQGKWAAKVRSLGPEYLKILRENYMGHIWANYREWRDGIEAEERATQEQGRDIAGAQARGKTPLKGSGAFLKQRTFDTQREGMEAGLIPVTTNPIEMQLLKLYEMQRFYHGVKLAEDIKNSGMAHWVQAGDEGAAREAGWVQLKDPAFQPRVPEAGGRVEHGNWWAPEPVARVFNNYSQPGLAGRSSIYDAVRGTSNALNSAQLSFSGFHATFIAFDTMMSKMALGLQQLSRGEPLRGAATMAKGLSPTAIFSTVMKGAALRDAYLHPDNAPPEMRKLVQSLIQAGGRIKMDPYYQSTAAGSFVKNLGDLKQPGAILHDAWQMAKDSPVAAPMRIVGRLLDTLNQPLMGVMVPRAKLGVFSELASDFLRRNPDATSEQTAAAMTKMWDSVDNRMGQLVYDNLFWNKTMKDLAFITTRSVGWNLGSVREIAGGGVDAAKAVADAARGKMPELTTRMAYTIAMPIITALYGAILTYAMTGKGPQSNLDYFYPPTGTETTPGVPDRTTMPGYIKDVMAFKNDPLGTIGNKTQPLAETAIELAKNRDYYGGIINMPGIDNPLTSYPEYLLNQAIPFSWRGWMKSHEEGGSMLSQALNFFGIQPAPQSITSPAKGETYDRRQDIRGYRARMKENAKGRISFGAPP